MSPEKNDATMYGTWSLHSFKLYSIACVSRNTAVPVGRKIRVKKHDVQLISVSSNALPLLYPKYIFNS